jgi:hypothetical protein
VVTTDLEASHVLLTTLSQTVGEVHTTLSQLARAVRYVQASLDRCQDQLQQPEIKSSAPLLWQRLQDRLSEVHGAVASLARQVAVDERVDVGGSGEGAPRTGPAA